jgi:hypothetical protein
MCASEEAFMFARTSGPSATKAARECIELLDKMLNAKYADLGEILAKITSSMWHLGPRLALQPKVTLRRSLERREDGLPPWSLIGGIGIAFGEWREYQPAEDNGTE